MVPYTARGEIWARPKEDIWTAKVFENGKIGPPGGYRLQGLRRPPFLHPKNKTIRGVLKVLKTITCLGGWTQDSTWRESRGEVNLHPHLWGWGMETTLAGQCFGEGKQGAGQGSRADVLILRPAAQVHHPGLWLSGTAELCGGGGLDKALEANWAASQRLPVSTALGSQVPSGKGQQGPGKGAFLGRAS